MQPDFIFNYSTFQYRMLWPSNFLILINDVFFQSSETFLNWKILSRLKTSKGFRRNLELKICIFIRVQSKSNYWCFNLKYFGNFEGTSDLVNLRIACIACVVATTMQPPPCIRPQRAVHAIHGFTKSLVPSNFQKCFKLNRL